MLRPEKTDRSNNLGVQGAILLAVFGTMYLTLQVQPKVSLVPYAPYIALGIQLISFLIIFPALKLRFAYPNVFVIGAWFFLFLFSLMSVGWSEFPGLAFQRTLLVFFPALLLILLVYEDRMPTHTFRRLAIGLVYFGFLLSIIGVAFYFVGSTVQSPDGWFQIISIGPVTIAQQVFGIPPYLRISSLMGNPNSLAAWLMVTVVLSCYLYRRRAFSLSLWLTLFVPQLIALILTYSRAGIATCVVMTGVFYILSGKDVKSWLMRGVMALVFCGLMVALFLLVVPGLGFGDRFTLNLSERDAAWMPLWESFLKHPLTGVGFGLSYESILQGSISFGAHNIHLAILSEIGLVGYALFFAFWGGALTLGFLLFLSICRYDFSLEMLTAIVIVAGLFLHQVFETQIMRYGVEHLIWIYLISFVTHPQWWLIKKNQRDIWVRGNAA